MVSNDASGAKRNGKYGTPQQRALVMDSVYQDLVIRNQVQDWFTEGGDELKELLKSFQQDQLEHDHWVAIADTSLKLSEEMILFSWRRKALPAVENRQR